MRIIYEYSHLGGAEIIQVRYPDWGAEINAVIAGVEAVKSKISKEKTKPGKALYFPIDMNTQFKQAFNEKGYHELRDTYTITIPDSKIAVPGAFKQIDFGRGSFW